MGKGPYKYTEQTGSKCTSSSRSPLVGASGKVSSSHGTNGQSKQNNMNQNMGNALGRGVRTFSKGNYKTAGKGHR